MLVIYDCLDNYEYLSPTQPFLNATTFYNETSLQNVCFGGLIIAYCVTGAYVALSVIDLILMFVLSILTYVPLCCPPKVDSEQQYLLATGVATGR